MSKGIFNWSDIIFKVYRKKMMSESERKFRSALYDILCEKADIILKKYNPCSFKEGSCINIGLCCCMDDPCRYLKNDQCSIKSLSCKLWLCDEARRKFPQCAIALDALALVANDYNFLGIRIIKDDIF